MSEAPTIEDYKKYVRELKTRIKSLTESNNKLQNEIKGGKKPMDPLSSALKINKSVLMIQKIFRGFIVRKRKVIMQKNQKNLTILGKNFSSNLVMEIYRHCGKIGLTLEMLFRAVDISNSGEVSNEDFFRIMVSLKPQLNRKSAERFILLLDESGKGKISKEFFLATLFAFNVSSESQSAILAREYRNHLLLTFKQENPKPSQFFNETQINREKFFNYLSKNKSLNEVEKCLIFGYYDKLRTGLIDRSDLDTEIKIQNYIEEKQNPISGNFYIQFCSNFDQKSIQSFFDKLTDFLLKTGAKFSMSHFLIQNFPSLSDFHHKLTSESADLIELKNKICFNIQKKPDLSKFLKVLLALKLEKSNIDTKTYFLQNGMSMKRRVEFSEFSPFAQSAFGASYQESTFLFKYIDKNNESTKLVTELCDDVNELRGIIKNGIPAEGNFESIKKKLMFDSMHTLEKVLNHIKEKAQVLAKDLDRNKTTDLFQTCMSGVLTDNEIQTLIERVEGKGVSQIQFYQLLDFLMENFGVQKEVIAVYIRVISGYLDKNQGNRNTTQFFKDQHLHPSGFYDKNSFTKKLRQIFGFSLQHCNMFFEHFKDPKSDTISIEKFIKVIESKRKLTGKQNKENKVKIEKKEKSPEKKEKISESRHKSPEKKADEVIIEKTEEFENNAKKLATPKKSELIQQKMKKKDKEIEKREEIKKNEEKVKHTSTETPSKISKPVIIDDKRPINNIYASSADSLISELESIKNDHFEEFFMLNEFVKQSVNSGLQIYEFRRFVSEIFSAREVGILLRFFVFCDKAKRGFISYDSWKTIFDRLNLFKRPAATPKKSIPEFKTNEDVFIYLTKTCQKDEKLPREFCNLFKENISTLQLLKRASEFYSKEGLDVFRHLILFFDKDKNGFFNQGTVKFIILLMNISESPALDIKTFIDHGLYSDIIKHLGNNDLDGFARTSALDLSENPTEINLFTLTHNLFFYLPETKLNSAIKFLVDFHSSKKTFEISYFDFMQMLGVSETLKQFEKQIPKEFETEIANLRKEISAKTFKSSKISHKLKEFFKINSKSEENVKNFEYFIFFSNKEFCKQKSEKCHITVSIDRFFESAKNKIQNCPLSHEIITEKIKNIVVPLKPLKILSFECLLGSLHFNLTKEETQALFDHLTPDNKIDIQKFLDFHLKLHPIKEELKKKKTVKLEIQNYKAYLESYKFKSTDFFRGKETILNGIVPVLKKALEMIADKDLFLDPEFGPSNDDPYGNRSLYFDEPPPGYRQPEEIRWKRPNEISQKPQFFDKDAKANDVNQGEIGNCWMISALSQLALDDRLLYTAVKSKSSLTNLQTFQVTNGVYPYLFHFLSKKGLYIFRFFKDYQWRFIIIDDLLPSSENELVFGHCKERNNFWVPLLEKAYSKLHGCYQAIIGGQTDQGVVDMTGLVSETISLPPKKPDELWQRLNEYIKNGCLMGCSVTGKVRGESKLIFDGEDVNLYCGHAYGLLDLLEINSVKLVRLRNPWGSDNPVVWNGRYSNHTKELIEILPKINADIEKRWKQDAEPYELGKEDGSFFMSYEDFYSIWSKVSVGLKFPEKFSGQRFACFWTEDCAGGTPYRNDPKLLEGYPKNPQFIMELETKTIVYLSLGQEDGRIKAAGQERSPFPSFSTKICLCVYKLENGQKKLIKYGSAAPLNQPTISQSRDLQLSLDLPPGKYSIIPSTMEPDICCPFFLSIYYDCQSSQIQLSEIDNLFRGELIVEEEETVKEFPEDFKQMVAAIISDC